MATFTECPNVQQIMFKHRTRAEIITTPAIDQYGRITAVDVDGNLYCLARDGKLYHEIKLPAGEAVSPIILGNDVIIATNGDHQLTRLDEDGQILWQATYGGTTLCSPSMLDNGNIVLPNVTGFSYFFDGFGAPSGVSSLGVQFLTTPCVDGNNPYCGSFANQGLYVISSAINGMLLYGLSEGATNIPDSAFQWQHPDWVL